MASPNIASVVSALLSILLPILIIALRSSIKRQRQCIIRDFEAVYIKKPSSEPSKNNNDPTEFDAIYPAFEFVKYKYNTIKLISSDNLKDVSIFTYFLSAIPLCFFLMLLGYYAFEPLCSLMKTAANGSESQTPKDINRILWIIGYIGTYLYTMRFLLASAENFDLTPLSFIAAAISVLIGSAVTLVFSLSFKIFFQKNTSAETIMALSIIGVFAIGYVPGLGLRTIMHYTNFRFFKKFDAAAYSKHLATPVEVIDGIDSNISERLSRFNIYSVQNLAATNPIMLFVETPFGIFTVLDWVAQAQLCCVVGRQKLTRLWALGIRTIFDLEEAIENKDSALASNIAEILFSLGDADGRREGVNAAQSQQNALAEFKKYAFDDLHVYRLRQIQNFLKKKLGAEVSDRETSAEKSVATTTQKIKPASIARPMPR